MVEASGLTGKSEIRTYKLQNKTNYITNIKTRYNPKHVFGEGLTKHNDEMMWLTWHEDFIKMDLKFNNSTLKEFKRPSQMSSGWGLTSDGEQLYATDGSDTLFILNPDNFTVTKQVKVFEQGSGSMIPQ